MEHFSSAIRSLSGTRDISADVEIKNSVDLFCWIRGANTREETTQRLQRIAQVMPNTAKYINGTLGPTMKHWAKYSIAWGLDFGLKATSPHEALHSSLKSFLRTKVPLHMFPIHLRTWKLQLSRNRVERHRPRDVRVRFFKHISMM